MLEDCTRGLAEEFGLRDTTLHRAYCWIRGAEQCIAWILQGRPPKVPHWVKERIIKQHARRFHLRTLVETGTFMGEMVAACREMFNCIISIELDHNLAQRARRRFARYSHILIVHGDSSKSLARIVAELDGPALFWLDAHYCGGMSTRGVLDPPILRELDVILSRRVTGDVVLIDDAYDFGHRPGYPSVDEVHEFVLSRSGAFSLTERSYVLRLLPA